MVSPEEEKSTAWFACSFTDLWCVDQYRLLNSWNRIKSCTVQCISEIPQIPLLIGNAPPLYCLLLHLTTFCLTWIPTVAPPLTGVSQQSGSGALPWITLRCPPAVIIKLWPQLPLEKASYLTLYALYAVSPILQNIKKYICTWIL